MSCPRRPFSPGLLAAAAVVSFALSLTAAASSEDAVLTDEHGVPLDALALLADVADREPVMDQGTEANAYSALILAAHRVPAEQLARQAHTDVSFANLVNEGRDRWRGWPVRFDGRLKRVRQWPTPPLLQESGLDTLYECWMLPDFSSGYPVVFLVSQLPAGIRPEEDMDRYVRGVGYFFKLYKYPAKNEQLKEVYRFAPLLIGKTLTPLDTAAPSASAFSGGFLAVAGSLGFAILVATVGLSWWYRRADRRVNERLQGRAGPNPFAGAEVPAYRRPDAPHSLEN
jgi:hypothetical protein